MKESATQLQPAKKELGPLKLASSDDIFSHMRETFDSIARRAYEIFESNGRQLGRDLEDWFRAEGELLHPTHLEMSESDDALNVKAEVPGFEAKDLEINLEPGRLTVAGKREWSKEEKKEKLLYSERRSNQLFRSLELPVEIDVDKATATLKDGVLELRMPKTPVAKKVQIRPKAA
ncbi:MAG TPA: Hsp20 family protein [Candidatus Acidoferrales bacterium]|nr:Hsp20 family protein [Candidatus Acidoferrales bacterium]